MQETNTKQPTVTQMSGSNLAEVSKPSRRKDEFSALRARLFLRRLLRARRIMLPAKRTLTVLVIGAMILAAGSVQTPAIQRPNAAQAAQPSQQTPAQLQQLVAPFALYPDALVAQILAASTYPTQIVEAERWLQKHSKLQGDKLAKEVDKESWDPSVKALTQFPSVLAKMNESLSWTSAVGEAYFNQQPDVLDAVQVMRKRAEDAGSLRSTPQQTVATQGTTIIIEPADPNVCYLPMYDPWTVYGAPLAVYPGYIFAPWVGSAFYFGPGIGLGVFGGYGWGWHSWGADWSGRRVIYNHNTYISRSTTINRNLNIRNRNTTVNGRHINLRNRSAFRTTRNNLRSQNGQNLRSKNGGFGQSRGQSRTRFGGFGGSRGFGGGGLRGGGSRGFGGGGMRGGGSRGFGGGGMRGGGGRGGGRHR